MKNKKSLLSIMLVLTISLTIHAQQETLIKRINCGGSQVTGDDGLVYDTDVSNADVSYSPASDALTHLSYVTPTLNEPYITSRLISRNVGTEFNYTFQNLSNAYQYRLIMHFAEPYHGLANTNWNTRVFDIDINNGEHFINDYNIMTEAALPSTNPLDGARKVSKINRVVNISGSSLTIKFTNVSNDALVNAIELYQIDNTSNDTTAPSTPVIAVDSKTDTSIDLSWTATDNVGVVSYSLLNGSTTIFTEQNQTNYSFTGLQPETSYTFSVLAFDAAGNHGSWGNINVTTLATGSGSSSGSHWVKAGSDIHYNDGNVGIGITNPAYELDMHGNLGIRETSSGLSNGDVRLYNHSGTTWGFMIRPYNTSFNGGTWDWTRDFGYREDSKNWYVETSFGIGTSDPGSYKLAVNGDIHAKEVKIDLIGWPDYVFSNDYTLPSLKEVEKHIKEKGHLINIPSAKEVEENGIQLGEINKLLLEKIEELTLYVIQQQREIETLKSKIK